MSVYRLRATLNYDADGPILMTTPSSEVQFALSGWFTPKRVMHRGACGTWSDALPVGPFGLGPLPTEFTSPTANSSSRCTLVSRHPAPGEVVGTDAVGIVHRHLIAVTAAQWTTDNAGKQLFVQVTSNEPRAAASELAPDLVAAQWRPIVSAVASALAHLHAMGLAHGAVQLDNVFLQAETWRLGPSIGNLRLAPEDDLHALSLLIDAELGDLITDQIDRCQLAQLSELCRTPGVAAAHVAVRVETDNLNPGGTAQSQTPLSPKVERTPNGFRLSTSPAMMGVFVTCAPHRAPRSAAFVPTSQLDQLGDVLVASSQGEAHMAFPQQTTTVFYAAMVGAISVVGCHTLVDPIRNWGNLTVDWEPEGERVALRWFWPSDISCRKMYVQVRPDRYPHPDHDRKVAECHRPAYEAAGQCQVRIPPDWNSVFVRIARNDPLQAGTQDSAYGHGVRIPPRRGRTTQARIRTRAVRNGTA